MSERVSNEHLERLCRSKGTLAEDVLRLRTDDLILDLRDCRSRLAAMTQERNERLAQAVMIERALDNVEADRDRLTADVKKLRAMVEQLKNALDALGDFADPNEWYKFRHHLSEACSVLAETEATHTKSGAENEAAPGSSILRATRALSDAPRAIGQAATAPLSGGASVQHASSGPTEEAMPSTVQFAVYDPSKLAHEEKQALESQLAALRAALVRFKWAAAPEQHRGTSAYPYEEICDVLDRTAAAAAAHDAAIRRQTLEDAVDEIEEKVSLYDGHAAECVRIVRALLATPAPPEGMK